VKTLGVETPRVESLDSARLEKRQA
jgi:hypothetical protein